MSRSFPSFLARAVLARGLLQTWARLLSGACAVGRSLRPEEFLLPSRAEMRDSLIALLGSVTPRGQVTAVGALLFLLVLPLWSGSYLLSVLITALWFAYVGQAWNLMMGFAGQLSLGHSLYVGLGAYLAAGFYVHSGLSPWLGVWLGVLAAAAAGAGIGALGFRFGVKGVYFALLTIAFAEFSRIGFDHLDWFGGSGGLFLPVSRSISLIDLRGPPALFYYLILAMTLGALALCGVLRRSRLGYAWLAVRENPDAAAAAGINIFRAKMMAVVFSAALTAPAGMFQAFFSNTLLPEQVFSMSRSLEILTGAIVGGIGTLFGPVLGAFVLTPAGELLTWILARAGSDLPGLKQFCYGVVLVVIILGRPEGLWPWLARSLGLVTPPGAEPELEPEEEEP